MDKSQIRCGYCGWLMASYCENILEHHCFKDYNETIHFLHIDENFVATIAQKSTDCNIEDTEPLSQFQSVNPEFDECLIMAVMDRPSLYDHRLNIKQRSKLKKLALWEEIKHTIDEQKHNDSEIQTALLDFIKEPIPHVDAIDGYLKTLGEALRRLPYRKRKLMEIKFFQMVLEAEEN
ncbi:PREDICTED: uncharacterized protein LOC108758277 [Trachymyrmex cornetzi]|uniref:uncharacterized protein LOC108758277 n=1 Tax=Trachymyrmex cornetzi TaxID=471704 RepID=UPI00084F1185|nr:PREDICTED: uncharacterized protein LOC108758277 [Trachymyrmex cornetzi]